MQLTLKKAIFITKLILMVVTTVIISWDVYVITRGNVDDATISYQMTTISEKFPFIPIAWGVLSLHFFGSKVGKKLFGKISKLRYAIWIPIGVLLLTLCIINLFKPIVFINLMGNYLLIPLFMGQALGLLWYQEKKG